MKKATTKESVILYKPKISLGATNKYDVYLKIEWGVFNKTIKLSRETPRLEERVVAEINSALTEGSESQPYEIR